MVKPYLEIATWFSIHSQHVIPPNPTSTPCLGHFASVLSSVALPSKARCDHRQQQPVVHQHEFGTIAYTRLVLGRIERHGGPQNHANTVRRMNVLDASLGPYLQYVAKVPSLLVVYSGTLTRTSREIRNVVL